MRVRAETVAEKRLQKLIYIKRYIGVAPARKQGVQNQYESKCKMCVRFRKSGDPFRKLYSGALTQDGRGGALRDGPYKISEIFRLFRGRAIFGTGALL